MVPSLFFSNFFSKLNRLDFFEYDMTDGWLYMLSGINSSDAGLIQAMNVKSNG